MSDANVARNELSRVVEPVLGAFGMAADMETPTGSEFAIARSLVT